MSTTVLGILSSQTFWTVVQGLSALALALFTVGQLMLARRDRREQQRTAYVSAHGESIRLWMLADWWERHDTVALARMGVLHPDRFFASPQFEIMKTLSTVSSGAAAAGAWAYATLLVAQEDARRLVHEVAAGGDKADLTRLAGAIGAKLKETSKAFDDGLRAAPTWVKVHSFRIVDPESIVMQTVEQRLAAEKFGRFRVHAPRGGEAGRITAGALAGAATWCDPSATYHRIAGGRHEPRLGTFGRLIGRWLAACAAWIDVDSVLHGWRTSPAQPTE